ncbi:MAG: aminodeoxychorismate lyase [Methylophilaceae bacterium]
MQNKPATIINGSLNNTISPLDRGLAYGDGIFRTLIVKNGLPEQWPLHYQTLMADCGAIGIVCPSAELLMSDLQQLFLVDETAVAKIIISRGDGERGYAPPAITAPMRMIVKSILPDYPESNFKEGVYLHVCETRLAHQPKLAGIKHLNRLENVLARMEFNDPAIADGLLLDLDDNVIECTSANIFARFNNILLTPKLDKCGVAGITRQRILALASALNLTAKTETFSLQKLLSADEIIICNSLYGAWQVLSVSGKAWPEQNLAMETRTALASHYSA